MPEKKTLILIVLLVIGVMLNGCGGRDGNSPVVENLENQPESASLGIEAENGLMVSGLVDSPSVWSAEELGAMELIEVVMQDSSGKDTNYQGVPLIVLLGMSNVQNSASQLAFRTVDGAESSVLLQDLNACINCIVALIEGREFTVLLPGLAPESVIIDVVEIVLY